MDTGDFSPIWTRFTSELEARHQKLYSEIELSWNNLAALVRKHADKISNSEWQNASSRSLSSILDLAKTKGSLFLFEPLVALKKARPQERALNAIDYYQSGIEDVVRLLPDSITVSRKDLKGCLDWENKRFRRLFLNLGVRPLTFKIRAAMRQALLEHSARRLRYDGRMLLLFSRATLSLLMPWQFVRNDALKALSTNSSSPQAAAEARGEWLQLVSAFGKPGARNLAGYNAWNRKLPRRLASAILAGDRRLSSALRNRARDRWQNCFRFWSGQQRVILAHLEIEASSARLLENAAAFSAESIASVDEEHAKLLSELDKASQWLTDWQVTQADSPFPSPEARLVSAQDRSAEWARRLEAESRAVLPVHIESMDLNRALPGRRTKRRSIAVDDYFAKSISAAGRETALAGFSEAEEGHRAVVRDIERAREVAAYSIEVSNSEPKEEEDRQVARDGIANALSLLDYQKKSATDYRPVVEARITEALASAFLQFHMRMEESRLGLLKHLARQKGSRAVRAGMEASLSRITTASRWLNDRIAQVNRFVLAKLGWSPPSTVALKPVVRREYLGELLNLKAGPRELPAIYKRLFRLAPVEDQRFLVGRQAEMAAVVQARNFWEEGRSVAILVTGARGSGKTSFLNCACASVFGDLAVASGQFRERITAAEDMRVFLSSLLEADAADLEQSLKSIKRLVVLEELERTFIRCVGGFHALRALLDLISATCRHTLWILSLNENALHYLTRAVGMDPYFSHRINATAVAPAHLRSAVLMRHNLSGLRLHFADPPSPVSQKRKISQLFGFEKDAEQVYFESLYRRSEGIFRSAFELWQQSVDRVEGGVLYMLHPSDPSFDGIISRLTPEDSFILQAILQHGSLTPEEISLIFDFSREKSRSCIDRLLAWEIAEPDPSCPGFRVRPEAGRMVRQALYRQNLL